MRTLITFIVLITLMCSPKLYKESSRLSTPVHACWIYVTNNDCKDLNLNGFNTAYILYDEYNNIQYKDRFMRAMNTCISESVDIYISIPCFKDSNMSEDKVKYLERQINKYIDEYPNIKGISLDYIRYQNIKFIGSNKREDFITSIVCRLGYVVRNRNKVFKVTMIPYLSSLYGQDEKMFKLYSDKIQIMLYPSQILGPNWFKNKLSRNTMKKSINNNYEPCIQGWNRSIKDIYEDCHILEYVGYSIFRLDTYTKIRRK